MVNKIKGKPTISPTQITKGHQKYQYRWGQCLPISCNRSDQLNNPGMRTKLSTLWALDWNSSTYSSITRELLLQETPSQPLPQGSPPFQLGGRLFQLDFRAFSVDTASKKSKKLLVVNWGFSFILIIHLIKSSTCLNCF